MNRSSRSLWYRQSVNNFHEALPFGSGRIGSVAYSTNSEVCRLLSISI